MKTLLKNFTIVTMNENLDVLKDAHLIVEDGKITDVATGAATGTFDEVIDGQNRPGQHPLPCAHGAHAWVRRRP